MDSHKGSMVVVDPMDTKLKKIKKKKDQQKPQSAQFIQRTSQNSQSYYTAVNQTLAKNAFNHSVED